MIDIQYFRSKKLPHLFFYEYQSRAQKWCKREQSQAGLNYAECSPFSHGKNNQLSDTLATFFSKNINLAHIKLISLFMMALCKARTVCFSKLSTCFDSPAKADSCLRRIQRFFSEHSSNTQERIDLVQHYIGLFGRETIDCLLADREFVGEKWIRWLNCNGIRYYIRIRENFWAFNPKSGRKVKVSWIFNHLKDGEADFFRHIFYVKGQKCYLSGSRIKGHDGKPELQITVSFNRPENAVAAYRQRWQIETMFKAMKSAGFNIEDTHLTDIERIEKILLLVMMAFVWYYNIGEYVNQNLKPIRILKHGRKAKSIFRYGLDIVTEYLTKGRNNYDIPIFKLLSPDNLSFTPI